MGRRSKLTASHISDWIYSCERVNDLKGEMKDETLLYTAKEPYSRATLDTENDARRRLFFHLLDI